MQAAAMGGVDRRRGEATAGQAGVQAALGTVAVNDVGPEPRRHAGNVPGGCEVADPGQSRHGDRMDAEPAPAGECIARRQGRHRVAHHADIVARRGLAARQVADVPEQATDRCAQDMDDAKAACHPRR